MFEGTVMNGVIILDGGVPLPEGLRVRVELADPDDLAPPSEPDDREKELAILHESIEDMRGMPFDEFVTKLAAKCNSPPIPPE